MQRVLLLATTTGYQTRSFGEAAERLGVELVFATDRCQVLEDPWSDQAIPIHFHDEAGSVAAITGALRDRPVDGVLAVGDRPTVIAARVAETLGLPGHPPAAAAIARNKELTRECLRAAGMPVPSFLRIPIAADPESVARQVSFPCVVKPIALSGSRGVIRADTPGQLAAAIDRLQALLRAPDIQAERNESHQHALIESFIPGREYAVEALVERGELCMLALFDKPDPLDGPFFEETLYITPSRSSEHVQQAIVRAVARAAWAIGLRRGPVHAECRVNDEGVFVLEAAARPIGGLCARSLRFEINGSGREAQHFSASECTISLEELLLRHALGESPLRYTREASASGVMMIPIPRRGVLRGVHGIPTARAVPHIVDIRITAKTDQALVPLPEGASYLGFIFARAATSALVERSLRDAHAQLTFEIETEFPVLRGA
jgi:ATP-grasp domain/L-amino acid ligase C-terminal domain 2/ATP-grasp N-terminal domain